MCGIFAAIKTGGSFDLQVLQSFRAACDVISHRGPDAQGFASLSTTGRASALPNLFLGHRRLAILDLDAASNQPFTRDGITLVYNGEVFNYIELRQQLSAHYHFETQSDTEVILRAWQHYGSACFGMFNGMWALLLYDAGKNVVVASRDRFSIKPLYMAEAGQTLYFASEIKQLKSLGTLRLSPNDDVLKAYLNQGLIDHSPRTFYSEIDRFPAMHCMEINMATGERKLSQYWDYTPEHAFELPPDPAAHFRELLSDSLRLRLRSDVPVGTLLSGGLDSSAISCLVHRYIDPDVTSFSVVSDVPTHSEERFVDILVNERGIKNHKLRFQQNDALEHVDAVLRVQDEPYGSLAVVAQYLLFKQIKEQTGITVLLSGQGADEVLLGYGKFFFFYLRQLIQQGKVVKAVTTAAASYLKGTTLRDFNLREAKRYLPGATQKGTTYYSTPLPGVPIWHAPNMRNRQIADIDSYSIPALAHYEDRNSMAASIEVRLPFLDYRLVDFLVNLPPAHKLHNGWTKHLLRQAVPELPKAIRWRKDKKGFITPEEMWMKGELGSEIDAFFGANSRLQELGILNKTAYLQALSQYRSGSNWLSHGDLFRVYMAEKWLREL
jgi:asparagine synthase (glutamine-hydrolysing)